MVVQGRNRDTKLQELAAMTEGVWFMHARATKMCAGGRNLAVKHREG